MSPAVAALCDETTPRFVHYSCSSADNAGILSHSGVANMNAPRLPLTLTVVNLGVLPLSVARHAAPVSAQAPAAVLRARALEIVDEQGRAHASLGVLPAGTSAAGEPHAETMLLRLITEHGPPSIKIGAYERTAGLSVADPTGTRDTYAVLEADAAATMLRLRTENGRELSLRP
jgi:hypothetical protein